MPQASDELRDVMERWFGDGISECGPMEFLRSHGFTLLPSWHWRKPTPSYTVSNYEYLCIRYLIDEWDFGGLEGAEPLAVYRTIDRMDTFIKEQLA